MARRKKTPAIRDTAARNELVTRNLGLVYHVVRRAFRRNGDLHLLGTEDDAFQVGVIGLIRAADMWDPGKPGAAKFSTYASKAIFGHVYRSIRTGGVITTPIYVWDDRRGDTWSRRCAERAAKVGSLDQRAGPTCSHWDDVPDRATVPDDEVVEVVRAAVASLPGNRRGIVGEVLLEGKSRKEVASRRHVSKAWVGDCIGYARPLLRHALVDAGFLQPLPSYFTEDDDPEA